MWVEELQKIDAIAVRVGVTLNEFSQRMANDMLAPGDEHLIALWSRNFGTKGVSEAVKTASDYLSARQAKMHQALKDKDMFHVMLRVYALGDFEMYLMDVHNVAYTPVIETHPVMVSVMGLSAQKRVIAEKYSVDYDASDAAIQKELDARNPWAN